MPSVEVADRGTFEVESGTRLVRAIEGNGVDILHRCGGFARCTTCRVEFIEGEPDTMTVAEREKLKDKGLLGEIRLSCQVVVEHDMSVRVINTLATSGLEDPGPEPEATVTPEPVWEPKP